MEARKYERMAHSKGQPRHSFIHRNNKYNRDRQKSQLEAAYDRGLAGLKEYLNQLPPKQRSQIISAISVNIKNNIN